MVRGDAAGAAERDVLHVPCLLQLNQTSKSKKVYVGLMILPSNCYARCCCRQIIACMIKFQVHAVCETQHKQLQPAARAAAW
jgi:hypothetical protein